MNIRTDYDDLLASADKYYMDGDCQKMYQSIQEAIRLLPDAWEAYILLGSYYAELKDYEKSIESTQLAIDKYPGCALGYFNIAQCHFKLCNKYAAYQNLKSALNLEPNLEEAHRLFIAHLIDDKNNSEALLRIEEALNHFPQDGNFNLLYAELVICHGDNLGISIGKDVLDHLDVAEKQGVDPNYINYLRGMYFQHHKDYLSAGGYFEMCLDNKYDEEIAELYMECLLKLKEYARLIEWLIYMRDNGSEIAKQMIEKHPDCFKP